MSVLFNAAEIKKFNRTRIKDVEKAHEDALKEHEAFIAAIANAANAEKLQKIKERIEALFDADFQADVKLEDCSELAAKVIRKYSQACYDDGKYLYKSKSFCNQKRGAHENRSWAATYDKHGRPVWVCTACKSVYARKEKA